MKSVLLDYALASDQTALAPEPARDRLNALRAAFSDLRSSARSNFMAVDRALRIDLSCLVGLRPPLETILARVPKRCEWMLP